MHSQQLFAEYNVTFEVNGLIDPRGNVLLIVYSETQRDAFPGKTESAICTESRPASEASSGKLNFTCNVATGNYAAVAYHDENANGKLDHSLLRKPEELLGLSAGCKPGFPPPNFDACEFNVAADSSKIHFINLFKL